MKLIVGGPKSGKTETLVDQMRDDLIAVLVVSDAPTRTDVAHKYGIDISLISVYDEVETLKGRDINLYLDDTPEVLPEFDQPIVAMTRSDHRMESFDF